MPTKAELQASIAAARQRKANPPPAQPVLTAHGKPNKGKPGKGSGKPQAKKQTSGSKRSPRSRDKAMAAKGRLPVGSEVFANWNGEKWKGELRAVTPGFTPANIFTGEATGLFTLLAELDDQYRKWLFAQQVPVIEEVKTDSVEPNGT